MQLAGSFIQRKLTLKIIQWPVDTFIKLKNMQVYMHPKKSVYNVTDGLIRLKSIYVITSIDPNSILNRLKGVL